MEVGRELNKKSHTKERGELLMTAVYFITKAAFDVSASLHFPASLFFTLSDLNTAAAAA